MAFKDMREFMDYLTKKGELKTCQREVDTKIEIGKVTDKSSKVGGSAILFKNVMGFKTPVVTGLYGTVDRVFSAIGTSKNDGFKKLEKGLMHPLPYKLVKDGPCKEIIKTGKDVDLQKIPVLWHHAKDKYYYITATNCRVKDPDTGICNSSINRLAVQGNDMLTIHTHLPKHLRIIANKYIKHGKACPISISVGLDPVTFICGGCSVPFGMDELNFAGGVIGEGIETVKCETIDIDVPATAELVIEGEIRPGKEIGIVGKSNYADEGPFSEITGYFGAQSRSPVIFVTAITHRKDYIYQGLGTACSVSEHHLINIVNMQSDAYQAAKTIMPFRDIVAISPRESSAGFTQVIAIKKSYAGQAKQLIYALLSNRLIKSVVIVDDDIDAFDHQDVEWAITYRANAEDYIFTSEIPGTGLDPLVTTPTNLIRKVGIDATLPFKGDKKGRLEILRDLGPAKYAGLKDINLSDYIK